MNIKLLYSSVRTKFCRELKTITVRCILDNTQIFKFKVFFISLTIVINYIKRSLCQLHFTIRKKMCVNKNRFYSIFLGPHVMLKLLSSNVRLEFCRELKTKILRYILGNTQIFKFNVLLTSLTTGINYIKRLLSQFHFTIINKICVNKNRYYIIFYDTV